MTSLMIRRRSALAGAAALGAAGARAQAAPIRIGVLTDESGPYADSAGPGSIAAARLALQDAGPTVLGLPVEIVHADTLNKPDAAGTVAREWYDRQGVDAIVDLPVTPVAAAVLQVARDKQRAVMITAAAVSEFTSKSCAPVSTHWADDTAALARGTAGAVMRDGGKTWFFVTVDIAFGHALQAQATQVIEAAGGKVLGSAAFPVGNADFSSQLIAAQASGADIIGCASVGNDQVNLFKQASEFGLTRAGKQRLAAFLIYINDVHALGLDVCQGLTLTSGFYWDQTDASRAFAKRFIAERRAMPSKNHASVYLAVSHYLRAMASAGTRDALAVNKAMRAMPFDHFGAPGRVRADGRVLYDLSLFRVKAPGESKRPWDYYTPVSRIAAADAFLPLNPSCAS